MDCWSLMWSKRCAQSRIAIAACSGWLSVFSSRFLRKRSREKRCERLRVRDTLQFPKFKIYDPTERGKTSMSEETLMPRPVRDSQSEMAEIVLPNDANPMAAHRHSRSYTVTASVDHIDFLVPVRVGDLIILRSSVNRVFHTSMETGV